MKSFLCRVTQIISCMFVPVALFTACGGVGNTISGQSSALSVHGPRPAIVPTHVITGAYLGNSGYVPPLPWSAYAPWTSWAETDPVNVGNVNGQNIKSIYYTDPNRTNGPPYYEPTAPPEPWRYTDTSDFAADCSGDLLFNDGGPLPPGPPYPVYLVDPSKTDGSSRWLAWLKNVPATSSYYAIFEDNTDDIYGVDAIVNGHLTKNVKPCGYQLSTWTSATVAKTKVVYDGGFRVVTNDLNVDIGNNSGYGISAALQPLVPYATAQLEEGCYIQATGNSNGNRPSFQTWARQENQELAMNGNGVFFCYPTNIKGQGGEDDAQALDNGDRLFIYSSFLLTYTQWSAALWETFECPACKDRQWLVNPETELVPTNPVIQYGSTATIDQLLLTGFPSTYGREWQACYIGSISVGRCAIVVNMGSSPTTSFPYTGYSHTLVINHGGTIDADTILGDGGTNAGSIKATGPAPGAVPALSGVIAFQ